MKIFCNMIVGYADKGVGYNTLWERSEEKLVGERNFSDVWPDGKACLLTNNNQRTEAREGRVFFFLGNYFNSTTLNTYFCSKWVLAIVFVVFVAVVAVVFTIKYDVSIIYYQLFQCQKFTNISEEPPPSISDFW